MSKYLKKDGLILINDPELSFLFGSILFFLNDEEWSFKVDVFNYKKNIFRSDNPWRANNAVARLLFADVNKFHRFFPQYKIIKNDVSECFILMNSGGINNSYSYIPLSAFLLKIIDIIDKIFIYFLPRIFACNRSVVLKKIK